jgi:hypothetical protein
MSCVDAIDRLGRRLRLLPALDFRLQGSEMFSQSGLHLLEGALILHPYLNLRKVPGLSARVSMSHIHKQDILLLDPTPVEHLVDGLIDTSDSVLKRTGAGMDFLVGRLRYGCRGRGRRVEGEPDKPSSQ